MQRCATELVSAVLLIGMIVVTSAIAVTGVLRYMFEHYRAYSRDVAERTSVGMRTSAHLIRYNNTLYLIVSAKEQVEINYTLLCGAPGNGSVVVGSGSLTIASGHTVVTQFTNVLHRPCVAVISEPFSVVYKVFEG